MAKYMLMRKSGIHIVCEHFESAHQTASERYKCFWDRFW